MSSQSTCLLRVVIHCTAFDCADLKIFVGSFSDAEAFFEIGVNDVGEVAWSIENVQDDPVSERTGQLYHAG